MPIQKNLNVGPYYDDFDPKKNYYKVLYKAGYPVQARELTQQQSITQDQIEQFASRILKEGDNVVPGEFTFMNRIAYVRLSSFTRGANISDFRGHVLLGASSGVTATVIHTEAATSTDDATLYVRYSDSGEFNNSSTFAQGEVLEVQSEDLQITAVVGINGNSKPVDTNAIGAGALFKITEGSYFIGGMMVRNDAEMIVVSKYSVTPSAKIGFLVNEEVITSNDDPSLLDNSQGSSNFAAPGADRLRITLKLAALSPDSTNANFVSLADIQEGEVLGRPGATVKWDWLYDILARRTYDESGNYLAKRFTIQTKEYANTDKQDGVFSVDSNSGLYPAVPGSGSTTQLTFDQTEEYYTTRLSSGKGYVFGYEVEYTGTTYRYAKKARDTNFRATTLSPIREGFDLAITNMYGMPDVQNISGDGNSLAFDEVLLYRNFTDGFVGEGVDGNGRPLNIGNRTWKTYHVVCDGNIGNDATGYTEIYKNGTTAVLNTNQTLTRGSSIGDATALIVQEIEPVVAGIVRPRRVTKKETVTSGDFLGYNSTYKLGVMDSEYFLNLSVLGVTNADSEWTVGDTVTGEISGAVGTVETGSRSDVLVLSNVVSEFIPGEEVIQGDKVSRLLRSGEITEFRFYDKGIGGTVLDLSSETEIVLKAVGVERTLTVADGEITVAADKIELTDVGRAALVNFPYPEGSELNQRIDYAVVTAPGGVNGYAVSLDARIENTMGLTKSFFSALADTNDFSADISIQSSSDVEILDVANASLFSGDIGATFVTCDNFSGDPSEQLQRGDLITFVDDDSNSINALVDFVTRPIGYGTLRAKSVIYLTTALQGSVTGKTVQRIRTNTAGAANTSLIYRLPQQAVATLEDNPTVTRINYQIFREFIVNVAAGSSTVTLTTSKNNETFLTNSDQTVVTVSQNITTPSDPNNLEGRTLTVSNIDATQDSARKVVYTLESPTSAALTLKIVAPVYVTNATAKRKIAREDQSLIISQADASTRILSLGKADVYKINSITMGGRDVTDSYEFDNGQRPNSYQISRLYRKNNVPAPNADLIISFDYFEHSGDGDFFSVDSYTGENGVLYRDIPQFVSNQTLEQVNKLQKKRNKNILELRDCVDFRPIVNTQGSTGSVIGSITDGTDAQSSTNYRDSSNGGNGFVPRLPIPGTQFQCDFSYYLPRYDSLFLVADGSMVLINGTAEDSPKPPVGPSESIRLYDLYLPAYTFDIKDIYIKEFAYPRYQMKDIARIDRQVKNLTQTVTLSLLEQDAINFSVRDAVTGLDRFKNGIVVDSFRDHSRGQVDREDYRVSIDPNSTHLRAPFFKDQVELEEINRTDELREGSGYQLNDGIITCNYGSVDLMSQDLASRWINCQPFLTFQYDGSIELFPPIDTFEDITTLPDITIEDNSLYEAMEAVVGSLEGIPLGSTWGEWETTRRRGISGNPWSGGGAIRQIDQIRFEESTFLELSDEFETVETSYGERVVNVSVAPTMRSIAVGVRIDGLKPSTRIFCYFDGIDITQWVAPDQRFGGYSDGKIRYRGAVGEFGGIFGETEFGLVSDDTGFFQGIMIIPNGRPPVAGQSWTGEFEDVEYQTEGETRSFTTGQRPVRFTSDPTNNADLEDLAETIADGDFVSQGVLLDVQGTIVSTRIPEITSSSRVTDEQERAIFERYWDPVAQTFMIDSNNPEGLFLTEVEVYFKAKDDQETIFCYLTDTVGQVPTENILPHSKVPKKPDSFLRVQCTLGAGITSESFTQGITVVGQTSGATGVIKSDISFDDAATNSEINVTNHVYDVILSNYLNEFIAGEEIVPQVSPASTSTWTITNQEYLLKRIDLTRMGSGYTTATVEFSTPDLPGGVTATAEAVVFDGVVYDITVTNRGSGYTQIPSITINGDGDGATAVAIMDNGDESVKMGVAISDDASAPTIFRFKAPVYLQGNETWYSFVLKPPNSLDYEVYTAKVGEFTLDTNVRITNQSQLGSLFKSQNGGLWTEDQTQDLKFKLRRAEFQVGTPAIVEMKNRTLKTRELGNDPIETNIDGQDTNSNIFGDNPQIIRVFHDRHGHIAGDLVAIDGITGNPGNIPNAEINRIHTVLHADFDSFTVKCDTSATEASKAGGSGGKSTYNRPYETLNIYTGLQTFSTSTVTTTNRATQGASVTGYNSDNIYQLDNPVSVPMMDTFYYTEPKLVASYINEANNYQTMRGESSLRTTVTMITNSPKVSPVLDLVRTNSNIIHNMIDNPGENDEIFGVGAKILTFGGDITAAGLNIGDTLEFYVDSVVFGATVREVNTATSKVKVSGQYVDDITLSTEFVNATLESAGVTQIAILSSGTFIPETLDNGSVFSKFISRLFEFENRCDGIEMKAAAIFYNVDDIKVYYRTRDIGFDGEIANVNWIPFNGTGLPDNYDLITPRSSENIDPAQITPSEFQELTWSVQDIPQFDGLAIKIVMTADNPALCPLIDDFRLIASE